MYSIFSQKRPRTTTGAPVGNAPGQQSIHDDDDDDDEDDLDIPLSSLQSPNARARMDSKKSKTKSRKMNHGRLKQSKLPLAFVSAAELTKRSDNNNRLVHANKKNKQKVSNAKLGNTKAKTSRPAFLEQEKEHSSISAASSGLEQDPSGASVAPLDDNAALVTPLHSTRAERPKDETEKSPGVAEIEQKMEPSNPSRRISSSSMEFIPPETLQPNKPSILRYLFDRETNGSSTKRSTNSSSTHAEVAAPLTSKRWKSAGWINLDLPAANDLKVECVAWDPLGVLLAVACSDYFIRIYDWDMVLAADQKGRSQRARNKADASNKRSVFGIPPVLAFRLPSVPYFLQWNPFNMNELVLGLPILNRVYLADVERISTWMERNPGRMFPQPALREFRSTGNKVTMVHFIAKTTLLIGGDRSLSCWSTRKAMKTWEWKCRDYYSPTCCVPFGSDHVLVGTDRGSLVLVNWKKTERVRGMVRTDVQPMFVHEIQPFNQKSLAANNVNGDFKTMAVHHIFLLDSSTKKSKASAGGPLEGTPGKVPWGRCEVAWLTDSGWLISTVLNSVHHPSGKSRIWHTSPMIKYLNAERKEIQHERRSYGVPNLRLPAAIGTSFACWTEIPFYTIVLPDSNKYVLSGQHQTHIARWNRVLFWRDFSDGRLASEARTIDIPKSCRELPLCVAVHPSKEWMILGREDGIAIMTAR